MQKKWVKIAGLVVLGTVLTVLVGLISFRTVAPTGVLIAPLAGIIPVAMTVAIGTVPGALTAVAGTVVLILLGDAGWLMLINYLLVLLFVGWIIGWQLPLSQRVSHQQLIWLALVSAIAEAIVNLLIVAIIGWQSGGEWLAYIRLDLTPSILAALLYAVLVGPVAMAIRWLARQIMPDDNSHDDPEGPVEIDLSNHDKKQK